jgi:ferric-dicitrate binding protein FerR (iron transport regulator)
MKATNDIDTLISKFAAGEAMPEEAMFLEDWKAESSKNLRYFETSVRILGVRQVQPSGEQAWQKVRSRLNVETQKETKVRKLQPVFLRIAAAVVVLAGIGALLLTFLQPEAPQSFTAENAKKTIHLTDGTSVVIARNSSVTLARDYGVKNRTVNLKGSGYFTVDHNEKLPFIVRTGPVHIKDLGTKFDVKTTEDTIFIRVDEGEVMIYDNKGTTITLKAGGNAHYVISTGMLEIAVERTGKPNATKVFIFRSRKLSEVVEALRVAYGADIRIQTPSSGNCLITTEFSDEDLDVALSVIAETLGLAVEKQQDAYVLTGTSCSY